MSALLRNSPETLSTHFFVESLPQVPLIARFDSAQMRQVFWNLAKNALQAMPNGGTFTIGMKMMQSGNAQVSFTDTGCGMSIEQQEKLFEPFSSSKARGTGLGLSIVYQIIQDHKGSISVLSKEGEGTAFIIELPGGSLAADSRDNTTSTNASEELAPLYG